MLAQAYSAFNRRNADAALALMCENVSWPKAAEGGRVVGREEIRAWTRQWHEVDPHVETIEMIERSGGRASSPVGAWQMPQKKLLLNSPRSLRSMRSISPFEMV